MIFTLFAALLGWLVAWLFPGLAAAGAVDAWAPRFV